MDLYAALDWINQNVQDGGTYVITLAKDCAITPTELSYANKKVTVTLKSAGGQRKISFEGSNPSYSLFIVGSGVTLTLEDGVTLMGTQNRAGKRLVEVSGGRFVMNGGAITGNNTGGDGGGVYVKSGAFAMNGGTISGNSCSSYGGGVYIASGTFIMSGGTISGNTSERGAGGVYIKGAFTMNNGTISGNVARYWADGGGGVYVDGTFTMNNGSISGNTAEGSGGGVYAGTFIMTGGTIGGNSCSYAYGGGVYAGMFTKSSTGGIIYGSNAPEEQANKAGGETMGHAVYAGGKKRNTTVRAATAMDSKKDGPAGGWE
jgi:hypothetical protein